MRIFYLDTEGLSDLWLFSSCKFHPNSHTIHRKTNKWIIRASIAHVFPCGDFSMIYRWIKIQIKKFHWKYFFFSPISHLYFPLITEISFSNCLCKQKAWEQKNGTHFAHLLKAAGSHTHKTFQLDKTFRSPRASF